MKLRDNYKSRLRSIYQKFIENNEVAPGSVTNLDDVFNYALQTQLWRPPKTDIRKRFRQDMAAALREEYFTDHHGRTVRRYHAVRKYHIDELGVAVQEVLWGDMLNDPLPPRDHMEVSFKQRRHQIVGDCRQLKNDLDYYNDKNVGENPIPELWDFTDDLADAEQPTEYSPRAPQKG